MVHRRCPACGGERGGTDVAHVALRTPDGHPLGGGYHVLSCASCGTGFADAVVPAGYYDRYYSELAKYAQEVSTYAAPGPHPGGPVASEPEWLARKAGQSAARVASAVPSAGARVLDVGCSTGLILGALARLGFRELAGVDPSPESVARACLRPGVRAVVGTFATLSDDLADLDCVLATGVLEHLWDPLSAVEALRERVAPGGVVYLEVPDAAGYLDPYVAPFEDFSTEHVNHFSLLGLRHLAARGGFETLSETTYLAPLSESVSTRCLAVTWRRTEAPAAPGPRDEALERALLAFARRSEEDLATTSDALEEALGDASGVAVWGIGEAAFKLLALAPLASREVLAYSDASPSRWGFCFGGRRVGPPGEFLGGDVPILAASFVRAGSIASAAAALGVGDRLVRPDLLLARAERT
ncbi:MAG: class I SAM-dependent methyltransferase [Actinomycetota bacterium]|nr:class I SAM-dependent methyltransferase [Actinomycetota bacterium]